MAYFRRRKWLQTFQRYLLLVLTLIIVTIIMECQYHQMTNTMESDSLHPITVHWKSMNLYQIIQPELHTTIIQPQLALQMCCHGKENTSFSARDLCVIIIVMSSPNNSEARKTIRESWANKTALPSDVQVLFMLGRTSDAHVTKSMKEEAREYRDLIVEDFTDSYDNLTLKALFTLKWVSNNCPSATHLLKTDDDMLILVDNLQKMLSDINLRINPHQLYAKSDMTTNELHPINTMKMQPKYLSSQQPKVSYLNETHISGEYVLGYLYHKVKPMRDKDSKWFLPYALYPEDYLPDFISGTAYVIATGNRTHGTLNAILMNALLAEFALPLEDVFITGVVAGHAMGIPLLKNNNGFHKTIPLVLPWTVSQLATCFYYNSIAIHGLEPRDITQGWKSIKGINKEKCTSLTGYFHTLLYRFLSLFEVTKAKS